MKAKTKFKILNFVRKMLNYSDRQPYIQIETQRLVRLRNTQIIQKLELEYVPEEVIVREMIMKIMEEIIERKYLNVRSQEIWHGDRKFELEIDIVLPRENF